MQLPTPTSVRSKEEPHKIEKMKRVIRRIKFESELDLSFGTRVADKAYGQKLLSCIQCGTCSATCPLAHYMDYTPRKIIAMTREGFKEEVLNSLTIWLCASCYSCYVQCPRQIHITDVMYALKREAIQMGFHPKRLPIPILAQEFYKRVLKDGRNTESWLLISLYLRTNPFKMLKESILGLKLFLRGRLTIGKEHVKRRDQIHAILEHTKGGQSSWKYLSYPGCSLRSTGRAYEESIVAVFKALEIQYEELEDWNCCGATSYVSIDETDAFALAARNLALAELQVAEGAISLIAPCSACYLVLSKTERYLEDYPDVRTNVNAKLDKAGLRYKGRVDVRHPLDVLVNDYGLENISKRVQYPLKGLKVASYYGCQVVRPFAKFDHSHYPETMDHLVRALGAEPVDWPLKTRCCGGSLTGTTQEAGLRLNRLLLKEAQKRGADIMLTCCPLCQHNLECYQERINRMFDEENDIPVAYFTQLMGVALGLSEKELGMHRLFKRPSLKHITHPKGATTNAW